MPQIKSAIKRVKTQNATNHKGFGQVRDTLESYFD